MAQRRRQDAPGAIHHVYARGMARRTVFERVRDIRVLLCLLALEVRRGGLEVIAFCFLTTHVHLAGYGVALDLQPVSTAEVQR